MLVLPEWSIISSITRRGCRHRSLRSFLWWGVPYDDVVWNVADRLENFEGPFVVHYFCLSFHYNRRW
jgi:hypothetical protein